jgi:endonuclease/exonuclease/phosphatase family metal-dependent hydrolase
MYGKYDPDSLIDIIASENPDILCINEMDHLNERNDFTDMVKIFSEELGYPYYFFGKAIDYRKGEYGNVVFSKYPIISAENTAVPETSNKEDRAAIAAVVDLGADKYIKVITSHFGLSAEEQVKAASLIVSIVEDSEYPVIFTGDLNCTPQAEQLAPIYSTLKDTAMTQEMLTYPADKPEKKIDYIFVSPEIEVVSAYVKKTNASDHLPYIATLNYQYSP